VDQATYPSDIVGESASFKDTLTTAHRCAVYNVSVLVRGETGCGKGVVAKFNHNASSRRDKPFLPVNCASISASIAESEFFGHVKGAYYGAKAERLGKFRAADGGTIFLDEIGDLPLEIQPKLLRVLEDKTLSPLGGDEVITVDVREIENAVCSLCAVGRSSAIGPSLLPSAILAHFDRRDRSTDIKVSLLEDGLDIKAYLTTIERELFMQALERADGNRGEAAKLLSLNAPAFREALRERFGVGDDGNKRAEITR
jgi:transcriptional regulator with GAF, ATPase, and Fis domain